MNKKDTLKLHPFLSKYKDLSHYKLQQLFDKIESLKIVTTENNEDDKYIELYDTIFNNLDKIRNIVITYYTYLSQKKDKYNDIIQDKSFINNYNKIIDIIYSKTYKKHTIIM
jgi:hypothetical protein